VPKDSQKYSTASRYSKNTGISETAETGLGHRKALTTMKMNSMYGNKKVQLPPIERIVTTKPKQEYVASETATG